MDIARTMSWARATEKVKTHLGLVGNSPQMKERIDDILVTINQVMWSVMGSDQMTARFNLKILEGGYFWAPRGHDVLDSINIDGAPTPIREEFHAFHLNGPGSGNWHKPVTAKVSSSATMLSPECADFYHIGVMSELSGDNKVLIEGVDAAGDAINTFLADDKKYAGFIFNPNASMVVSSGIRWKDITRIEKRSTNGTIKIWAFPNGDRAKGECIATLSATSAGREVYTKYKLGANERCCEWPCVEAKFRIASPSGPSENVWVSEIRHLVALASAADNSLKPGGNLLDKENALRTAAEIAAEPFLQSTPGERRVEVHTELHGESFYQSI